MTNSEESNPVELNSLLTGKNIFIKYFNREKKSIENIAKEPPQGYRKSVGKGNQQLATNQDQMKDIPTQKNSYAEPGLASS